MTDPTLLDAAAGRARAVAPHLLPDGTALPDDADALWAELAAAVRRSGRTEEIWLLVVALTAAFPDADQVRSVRRALELAPEGNELPAVLAACRGLAVSVGRLDRGLEVVTGRVVVDVDFCATEMHNTGIQRVVRQTVSRWEQQQRDLLLVAWFADFAGMRQLGAHERRRVTAWGAGGSADKETDPEPATLVVPFRCSVVVPEVPVEAHLPRLAALAEFSGNRVGLVAYDTIPIASADTVPVIETERFAHYLTLVKHADRLAAISATAADEFRGFGNAVQAQGLTPPEVEAVVLPVALPDVPEELAPRSAPAGRTVLCVGSQEPRKNQLAVLFAAEVLWGEGHDFALQLIGGGSRYFTRRLDRVVRRLAKQGHRVAVGRGLSDQEMLEAYRSAMFTVFPSTHEGYGLPVAESLTVGVPVITTGYGSTAEIAEAGGCLLVDPRDDDSLIDAMRSLLTDDELLDRLRSQARARVSRSWSDYAGDLWDRLVLPLGVAA